MKIVINLILLLLIAALVWMLIDSIREPIVFQSEMEKRTNAVEERLRKIRVLQETYRDVEGMFAGNFDDLFRVVREGQIMQIAVYGNKDDQTIAANEIRRDTTYVSVRDYLNSINSGINVDSLDYLRTVPYSDGKEFSIEADTILYQSTPRVPVVQVGTHMYEFMGKYADKKYAQYDNSYNPNRFFRFGDLSAPNLSGNWE